MVICKELKGLPVCEGVAIGEAYVYQPFVVERMEKTVADTQRAAEAERIEQTLLAAEKELEVRIAQYGDARADLLNAHLMTVKDPFMREEMQKRVTEQSCCAEQAIYDVYAEMIEALTALEDEMYRERAADLRDVRSRLLRCCAGLPALDLGAIDRPVILLAHDLAPSDTACLNRRMVLGIATEIGGATAHTAILAKSLGIPAVLGIDGLLQETAHGALAVLDGTEGVFLPNPEEETVARFKLRQAEQEQEQRQCAPFLRKPAVTSDGTSILTEINLGSTDDLLGETVQSADGVGLLRTEFLYMQGTQLPSEEMQYAFYTKVLQAFGDRPVILRTLDIGGDKHLPYLKFPEESNPFLGLRALRYCLANEEVFRVQLRAAYRASVAGNLQIMFPMVGDLEDFRRAKEICVDVQRELKEQQLPFRSDVKLGIMIEIPSVALLARAAAKETDFASIGTNDLCQYLCAADRVNPETAPYYRTMSPALFHLIGEVAAAYAGEGKPVGVCGELAGNPTTACVLVGLGIRQLSMSGGTLSKVKQRLCAQSIEKLEEAAEKVLAMPSEKDVIAYLNTVW